MATTISIALPQNYSPPPPPPHTSLLSARRPRSLSLSTFRTNPAFMTVSICSCVILSHIRFPPEPDRTGFFRQILTEPSFPAPSSANSFPPFPSLSQWLSVLLLRVHQNALVANWLNSWQWLSLPSTSSSASASLETAWLRGWVATRQHYVMNCWDAVWYHIFHPSAFTVSLSPFPLTTVVLPLSTIPD